MKADGLPNAQGAALVQALNVVLREKRLREDVAFLQGVQRTIDAWLDHKAEQERACFEQRRWFTHEQQEDFLAARPTVDPAALRSRLKKPGVAVRLGPAAQAIARSLAAWEADHRPAWAALNAAHMERELVACKELLDRVESKPLTPEQARADACFDNRVQVVASAGSGKTSMMVAKAAYAIHRGFVDPKRIVLLAFNTVMTAIGHHHYSRKPSRLFPHLTAGLNRKTGESNQRYSQATLNHFSTYLKSLGFGKPTLCTSATASMVTLKLRHGLNLRTALWHCPAQWARSRLIETTTSKPPSMRFRTVSTPP
ncbi:hypothetical protein ARC23_07865 [Stenotrophomonas beteli]|uniref:UvrD-like helicase ATP-binding domain-containing protein n=1 Tax=Stenotrophomonas beteli TaxID=3384461 RepID=A0A0R0BFM6_9GAMM|nr:hypothetical protein ARC23_07865 [Stenotrophomonas maltophilia]